VKKGLVIRAAGDIYTVIDQEKALTQCKIKGNFRIKDLKSTNPVTVGDIVMFDVITGNNRGFIIEIKERKNYIIRKSTNWSKQYQIIAANVEQSILVITIKEPDLNFDFIDRYLVAAESFSIPVTIVINKYDIYNGELLEKCDKIKEMYTKIGYNCFEISVLKDLNLDHVIEILKNKISVINGNSGVGKSALINKIDPNIHLKIGTISSYHRTGMHTTSYSEMYALTFGGYVIDTPGIKGFGLIDFYKEELYHYFPEIFELSKGCKFNNCLHIHEPECAVLEAVKNNDIALSRYSSYYNLFYDDSKKYRI
jgi:ribosome biogenesis GTPase / thiamine phosphate phosphatase